MQTPLKIDNFWKLETIGITPQEDKEDDETVLNHFKRLKNKEDGRYHVARP